jgi:hypothetical protein
MEGTQAGGGRARDEKNNIKTSSLHDRTHRKLGSRGKEGYGEREEAKSGIIVRKTSLFIKMVKRDG